MSRLLYYVLAILQLVGVLLFCAGFFPQKVVLKHEAEFLTEAETQLNSKPVFKKMVMIIIDAMRSDFLFQKDASDFEFMHQLLNSGEAWGYTSYSNPPTVTLPRLKGITTGSAPNFLDAILNVAEDDNSSNLKEQDSLIKQFNKNGYKINFFGDDTWLKLFPLEFFSEFEGTNSFFVSDFKVVDLNVTRHVPHQLSHQNEWDILILHYLGLDHIGHKGGARSMFMPPKHREMDAVIKQVYENIDDDTLLVVMGDHGMNDLGNHGGSGAGETSAAMAFASKKLVNFKSSSVQESSRLPIESVHHEYKYLEEIQQIDIVPTLSMLFNLPIPKNSMGIVIEEFLQLLPKKISDIKVQDNYLQLTQLKPGYEASIKGKTTENLMSEMRDIQASLAMEATNYNYNLLSGGIGTMILGTLIAVYASFQISKEYVQYLSTAALLGFSMFASSFVEEEHQIWWWVSVSALMLMRIPYKTKFAVLVGLRFVRGWNNSGQKYIYENVLHDLLKSNTGTLWFFNTVTILSVGLPFLRCADEVEKLVSLLSVSLIVFSTLTYKVCYAIVNGDHVPHSLYIFAQRSCAMYLGDTEADESMIADCLVPLARMVFRVCAGSAVVVIFLRHAVNKGTNTLNKLLAIVKFILILQTSAANIPMYLIFEIINGSLGHIPPFFSLCLQHLSFFQFGGTNSIATINLTNAYNGVSSNYNIYVVGVLMVVSNYAPSIYWAISSIPLDYPHKILKLQHYYISGTCLVLACVALRYHLFVWSVFSPKLCYFASWTMFNLTMDFVVTLLSYMS